MQHSYFKEFIVLQRGFDLPKREMCDGPYPVVGSTSIIGFHNEYKIEPPGVVTGRSGSLGFVQYIRERYWPHNTSLWVKDFKGNLPQYVYYFLKTLNLQRFNSGVGVPTLNRNDLDTFEVSIHPINTQRKIAAILSAYDDLIENNLRRIKILEEIAQNLYTEWFVRFRFPGHEKVKMVDSPLGKIPEGWGVTNIRELIDEQKNRNKENRSLPVLSVTHNRSFVASEEYFSKRVYSKSVEKYKVLQKSEFAFNPSRLNIGSIAILDEYDEALVSPMYIVFRVKPNRITPFFLWQVLNQDEAFDQIRQLCFGTVRQTFKFQDFGLVKFVLPPIDLRSEYENLTKPVFAEIDCLFLQVSNLRQTRDLLLPKLISGELDVSDLDIKTGDDE